jgi:hypothetical protein
MERAIEIGIECDKVQCIHELRRVKAVQLDILLLRVAGRSVNLHSPPLYKFFGVAGRRQSSMNRRSSRYPKNCWYRIRESNSHAAATVAV